MAALDSDLRKQLEKAIVAARREAVAGVRESLREINVHEGKRGGISDEQAKLRNQLRAHGRQIGDRRNSQSGVQEIDRLVQECAYEHWHRMIFLRFLAENELLVDPEFGQAISYTGETGLLELAEEAKESPWVLGAEFASKMLPAVFKTDDPVFELKLPIESQDALEDLLNDLPREVFEADDSLGWVYQFWQSEEKDEVNRKGEKITGRTLPAVTQLFTEHYMVLFLLHNTIGAWHAAKVLAANPDLATNATDEDELRAAVALETAGGYQFEYLRFVREPNDDGEGTAPWRPMGGTFDGWPKTAAELTVLDPSCGSGHFLVAALELLVRLRMHEEGLALQDAIEAVLADNLFGLEIDPRCTQIAAFNLAMAAWKLQKADSPSGGQEPVALPPMRNIACSGIPLGNSRDDWMKSLKEAIPGSDLGFQWGQLYDMFSKADTLGSLINPRRFFGAGMLTDEELDQISEALSKAIVQDPNASSEQQELAAAAQGLVRATEILAGQYTLVITNVPYLGRGKQEDALRRYLETQYSLGKPDLATAFVLRCLEFCSVNGTTSLVTPQNWLFLSSFAQMRGVLLERRTWDFFVQLGEHAFVSSAAGGAYAALVGITATQPALMHEVTGIDASAPRGTKPIYASQKAEILASEKYGRAVVLLSQTDLLESPDSRVTFSEVSNLPLLEKYATNHQGLSTGDNPRFRREHWEISEKLGKTWVGEQSGPDNTSTFAGRSGVLKWEEGSGELRDFGRENVAVLHNVDRRGEEAWGKLGVAVRQRGTLPVTLYTGEHFDTSVATLVPMAESNLPALWCFCESAEFPELVRKANPKVSIDNGYFTKVPIDIEHWKAIASKRFPGGLPEPESDDPTQWIFHGLPSESTEPLQVSVARLLGYRWPAERDSEMHLSKRARELVGRCSDLDKHVDADGIVCLPALRGEDAAADRLLALLSDAGVAYDEDLDRWLRERFFKEHCDLFQQRPFVWHIWDGNKEGFSALVNYHKLAGPTGAKVLESLTYSYLGDWITRQEAAQKNGESGADARLLAARELQERLIAILKGEPPYDLFVRWKPLHKQPIGWQPDINDGVRVNIRPFMGGFPGMDLTGGRKGAGVLRHPPRIHWKKDRGKEPKRPVEEYPWFWSWDQKEEDFQGGEKHTGERWNACHYSIKTKQDAREKQS